MTIEKTADSKKCVQGCREIRPLIHCWWEWKMEKNLTASQKIEHRFTIWSISFILSYIFKKTENMYSHNLYVIIHGNIMHNS